MSRKVLSSFLKSISQHGCHAFSAVIKPPIVYNYYAYIVFIIIFAVEVIMQYFMVALAPLIILTAAGVVLIPVMPQAGLPALLLFLIGNSAGSVGDLWVVSVLLREPREVLLQDEGDAVTCFGPPPV
jgi:hypothetical protein